ncbi:MAG: AI-2E family transporter [Flavobacteriales bacterium]|nr:AI-2E family transporter [Flavobacteriales bacterium]
MEPVIIGSEVKQNPLFVIIAIILGGVIWGLPGLILFVPFFAILKIFFDHSTHLKPVGYLMGYESGISQKKWMQKIKGIFKKD